MEMHLQKQLWQPKFQDFLKSVFFKFCVDKKEIDIYEITIVSFNALRQK
jgi:hypothetical protein